MKSASSAPFKFTEPTEAVAVPTKPALPVTNPLNVFAPAIVCVPVDTMPPSAAVAFGMFRFIVAVLLE